jgi:hypothetical protein
MMVVCTCPSARSFIGFFFALISAFCDSIQPESLLKYAYNTYSQRGEDGILEEILSRLNITEGFFVEFGAWDGIHFSNTKQLADRGWRGVFIECCSQKFLELQSTYRDQPGILCIEQFVTHSSNDQRGKTIDAIRDQFFPDQEIDFMSIDIDGGDYLILENLQYKPKILCIEGGFSWNPRFTKRVPDEIALYNLQQPLSVMIEIGRLKGYEPICFTQNTFFIRKDLYGPFSLIDNNSLSLWKDAWIELPEKRWLNTFRANHPLIRKEEGLEFLDLDLLRDHL